MGDGLALFRMVKVISGKPRGLFGGVVAHKIFPHFKRAVAFIRLPVIGQDKPFARRYFKKPGAKRILIYEPLFYNIYFAV